MPETTSTAQPCLARESELAQLEGLLGDAVAGRRSVCFVTGEAGAGKTTLLAEFCMRARRIYPDLVIADGRCDAQTGAGDAYLPFREILAELTGHVSGSAASPGSPGPDAPRSTRIFRLAARTLVEHGPDLVDIFVPGGALVTRLGAQAARESRLGKRLRSADSIAASASGIDQTHICEQYTNVLRQLAQRHPLVVIIDDLHWADSASLDLLFHLARRLESDPVLLVGSFRPEAVAAGRQRERHPLETTVNEIRRYYGDVEVQIGAAEDRGMDFINQLLDAEPNALGAGFREALFRHTGGHALFTVELLRDLRQQGAVTRNTAGEWIAPRVVRWEDLPARIEGVIDQRLGRLDADAREVLSVAAVAGDSFAAELVAAALGKPVHEVVRTLSQALSRQHLLVRPVSVERRAKVRLSIYEFRHSVFQKFIYQALDDIERVHLHEHVGRCLEDMFADSPASVALQLARHFEAAGELPDAVRYLAMAARRAYASHAIDDAAAQLRHALDLLHCNSGSQPPEESLQEERREIHRLLGAALERKGDYTAARRSLEQALQLTGMDRPVERAELQRALGRTWERQSDYGRAAGLFEDALRALGDPPAGPGADWWQEWISTRLSQLWLAYWTRDIPAMEGLIGVLEPHISGHGDPQQRRRLWTGRSLLGYRRERFRLSEATVAACDEALAASRETPSLFDQAEACFGAGFARLFTDEPEAAAGLLNEARELAEKIGDVRIQGQALTYLSIAYRQAGDLAAVRRILPTARDAATAVGAGDYLAVILANESWLAWRAGDASEAGRLAEEAIGSWSTVAPNYPLQWLAKLPLIAISLDEGNLPRAVELGRSLLAPSQALLGPVSDAVKEAVALFDARDTARTREALRQAVSLAADRGYL